MSDKDSKNLKGTMASKEGPIDYTKMELAEEVIQLNRVAKVVKGGRRFSFSALVVVGDKNGHVGLGFGKANEVPESIQKGVQDAKKNLIRVPRVGRTIPYAVDGVFSAAKVMLKPAGEGTGIIAGPPIRSLLELGGVQDILTKNLGSSNVINILKAVMEGLKSIRDAEEVMKLRGKKLEEVVGKRRAAQLRESSSRDAAPAAAEEGEDERDLRGKKESALVVAGPASETLPEETPPVVESAPPPAAPEAPAAEQPAAPDLPTGDA